MQLTEEIKKGLRKDLALKWEKETTKYKSLKTEADCKRFIEHLEKNRSFEDGSFKISPRSLKQVLGLEYVPDEKKFLTRNLDSLANYLDYADFNTYLQDKIHINIDEVSNVSDFDIYSIEVGEQRTLGWPPEKFSTIKYLDNFCFEVIESNNMSKSKGELFYALAFELARTQKKDDIFPDIKLSKNGHAGAYYEDRKETGSEEEKNDYSNEDYFFL